MVPPAPPAGPSVAPDGPGNGQSSRCGFPVEIVAQDLRQRHPGV